MAEYAERDSMELDVDGGYYAKHIAAMTKEGLYSKSAIADELAWRDREIDRLKTRLKRCEECLAIIAAQTSGDPLSTKRSDWMAALASATLRYTP